MSRIRIWQALGCAALVTLLVGGGPAVVAAQETTGTITGIATDSTGAVLPGVTVTVKSVRTGTSQDFVTNENGLYTAPLLQPGVYEVTFALSGFQTTTVKAVELHVNDRLQIDGRLGVGGVTETVEVSAASPLVQPTAAIQTLVDPTQVQQLPLNNRNFVQLATLAPGVSSDLPDEVGIGLTSSVSISVNGSRRNAVNWLVDGVSNVDVGSNITLLSTPTLESIEEFKIITNSYAAEWPRSGGGVVNVVTKSGTNKLNGSAYEFFRNDKLNANSWLRNHSSNLAQREAPKLRYNNFGYTAGGPIRKDKAFFFWSQEWRRIQRAPASLVANVPNPDWLNDPTNSQYVAPALRDPNAVKLLALWPAPNLAPTSANGPARYAADQPAIQNTRQEVIRVDYDLNAKWRVSGRYTHDLSETREIGGLFVGIAVPNIATTDTTVPGQIFAFSTKTIFSGALLNDFQVQRSSNAISTVNPAGTKNKRSDYGVNIPELFPENASGFIPRITVSGLATISLNTLYDNNYYNWSLTDNLSWQRGNHAFKFGGLATVEAKNENALANTMGSFSFAATSGGRTAFQNFLTGNQDGTCTACTYAEDESDIRVGLRFNRFEFYGQDTWRVRNNVTLDYGVRYSLYPPLTEVNNRIGTFNPAFYDPAKAPKFTTPAGTLVDKTTGDPTNGIMIAGVNSPYGDAIYKFQKGSIQPRVGLSWDPKSNGTTIVRGAFGIYYDQPLVGIFEWDAFYNPPFNNSTNTIAPSLSNPGAGTTPTTRGMITGWGTAADFKNPRTTQWNVGLTREVFTNAALDVSYVGSRGDNLIRPTDPNYPMPADVVALQDSLGNTAAVNPARPYVGFSNIRFHDTNAISRYQGLLTGFRWRPMAGSSINLNYTLSRNQTDSTNDRDTIDVPQNPRDPMADYADARTDRRHIFTASFVYELPAFRDSAALLQHAIGGWQISGITYANSGQPVPRISDSTNNFRRGGFADQVGDPNAHFQYINGVPYWFDPTAYAPAQDGKFGTSTRSPFRQPGFYKWDLSLAKFFPLGADRRLQFRADFINAFNQVNWNSNPTADGLDNTCTTSVTSCTVATDSFGQLIAVRAPREIQLSLKLYW